MGTWLVGWLVGSIASWLIGVRVAVRVDVPGHRGAADSPFWSICTLDLCTSIFLCIIIASPPLFGFA